MPGLFQRTSIVMRSASWARINTIAKEHDMHKYAGNVDDFAKASHERLTKALQRTLDWSSLSQRVGDAHRKGDRYLTVEVADRTATSAKEVRGLSLFSEFRDAAKADGCYDVTIQNHRTFEGDEQVLAVVWLKKTGKIGRWLRSPWSCPVGR
jgi:hypothetical protein